MSNEMEDISEALQVDASKDLRDSMGKTSIAFFDIDQMGAQGSIIVFVAILAIFAGIFRWLYVQISTPEEDINETRKEMLRMRKEKKLQ